ncbi:hypothetical protein F66182_4493 [Fusarium sp. NRRL 66182]|nr:hypothetical protein F66182_4493 [Fusarium sp. NRRL 66182]
MGTENMESTYGRESYMTPLKPASRAQAGRTPQQPIIDLTDETYRASSSSPSHKRKAHQPTSENASLKTEKEHKVKKQKSEKEEKRERRFRTHPPQSFHDIYGRALSQRFYVLNRVRGGAPDCPEEDVEMTGSTGNIYTVHVMKQVLNAPFELIYQLALLSTELCSVFAAAPPISAHKDGKSDKRKPIEGDCPICYCELDESSSESIVWCEAACGQNMHEQCFKMWARTKSGDVTCPMCRSVWKSDEDLVARVQKDKGDMTEGYVNVADQLGISRERDESSYSSWYGYHQGRRNGNWGSYIPYEHW